MKSTRRLAVLLTCAGGSAPLAFAKQLRKKYSLILADADKYSLASHLGLPFIHVPMGNDPSFASVIRNIIKKYHIDFIVPGADEELLPLTTLKKTIPFGMVAPCETFIRLCLHKGRSIKRLHDESLTPLCPFTDRHRVRFPLIAKPAYGRGSRAVHRLENRRQLDGYFLLYGYKPSHVVLEPSIPGDEWTVSVIVNNRNQLIKVVPKRVLLKRGITRAAMAEDHPVIERVCRRLVETMKPFGPCNVQLKYWKGRVYIFEINPRLSTTSVLTDRAFGNEIVLYINAYDRDVQEDLRTIKRVALRRFEENIFFPG